MLNSSVASLPAKEFNMIHPPDVIGKYAPQAIIGMIGAKAAAGGAPAAAKPAGKVQTKKDVGHLMANHHYWGDHEGKNYITESLDERPGALIINFESYFMAGWFLMLSVLYEVCATIFSAKNFKVSNDRVGLTRSAILLILFIVIHAVGNLHVFMGPDDFNGYGYFYVRLYWTGFGLPANIVEEYILLSAMLHMFVGIKRSWDKKGMAKSAGIFPTMNLAVSGVMLGTFMTIHLFQFRFGATHQFFLRPPPMLISWYGIPHLNLFWTSDTEVPVVPVRDIYKLEYQIFNGGDGVAQSNFWAYFYIFSVVVFVTHGCLGWQKVTPVLGIPKLHIPKVEKAGYAIFLTLGVIYISFPVYCMMTQPFAGIESALQPAIAPMSPGA